MRYLTSVIHLQTPVVPAAGVFYVTGPAARPTPSRRYFERATSIIFSTRVAKATISIITPMMTVAVSLFSSITSFAADVSTARLV